MKKPSNKAFAQTVLKWNIASDIKLRLMTAITTAIQCPIDDPFVCHNPLWKDLKIPCNFRADSEDGMCTPCRILFTELLTPLDIVVPYPPFIDAPFLK